MSLFHIDWFKSCIHLKFELPSFLIVEHTGLKNVASISLSMEYLSAEFHENLQSCSKFINGGHVGLDRRTFINLTFLFKESKLKSQFYWII
jgi:hypothetical protein